jgi:hypothetical protein
METGIYVTFLDADEPANKELPPVGPLDHVVDRHKLLLAERRMITQAEELGVSIGRWLEAELELQRAMGQEPGGTKRTERRFIARDGVFLRFVVFGDQYERDPVPELGPFAVVHVSPRGVEADGTMLATRAPSELASWVLTDACGDAFAGAHKSDIALRSSNSAYHHTVARITPKPTLTASAPASFADQEPVTPESISPRHLTTEETSAATPPSQPEWTGFVDRPARQVEVYSPQQYAPEPTQAEPELTPADRQLIERIERDRQDETLRARIQDEERKRLGVDTAQPGEGTTWAMRYRTQPGEAAAGAGEIVGAEEEEGRQWGAALWRTRFVIIGVLLLIVAAYYGVVFVTGGSPGVASGQVQYVGIAQKFSGTRWDYTINGTQTTRIAGTSVARGQYYVVRLAVTNKGTEGLQISPSDFTLVDPNGTEYRAEGLTAGPYQTSANTSSPFIWPQTFPIGRASTLSVVFDLAAEPPRGALLKISELPNTRVRLD